MLAWATIETRMTWGPKVHGVVANHSTVPFLYKTWIEK
jgi:hypothetical protein